MSTLHVGDGCSANSGSGNYTLISKVAADVSGSCDRLDAYDGSAGGSNIAFAFFSESSGTYTQEDRIPDSGSFSNATGDECKTYEAPGDFTAFSVTSGWYLGAYSPALGYNTATASGDWWKSGDNLSGGSSWNSGSGDPLVGGFITESGGSPTVAPEPTQVFIWISKLIDPYLAALGFPVVGAIRDPRLSRREWWNPLNWVRK